MATSDFVPDTEAEFDQWLSNLRNQMDTHGADLGFNSDEVAAVYNTYTNWHASYLAHLAAVEAARSAKQAKDAAKAVAIGLARKDVRRLQANPKMTDALRAEFRITIPDNGRTTATMALVSENRPVTRINTSQRLQHQLQFVDENTPTRRAKPQGVAGAEVWVKIGGEAPVDPSELTFLALPTRTSYTATFNGADAGKPAYYMLRWVNTRGEKGPWSRTVSATIAA